MAVVKIGWLSIKTFNADGEEVSVCTRGSINPSADTTLIYKALEFRDAAARDGRVFVCTLVSKRKARLLRLLGVRL